MIISMYLRQIRRPGKSILWMQSSAIVSVMAAVMLVPGSVVSQQPVDSAPHHRVALPSIVATEVKPVNDRVPKALRGKSKQLVTLSIQDSTVGYALRRIAEQPKQRVLFDESYPQFKKRISINISQQNGLKAVTQAIKGTGLVARIAPDGETIMVRPSSDTAKSKDSAAAKGKITGQVIDSATGRGIQGVVVTIPAVPRTITTDERGQFSFENLAEGKYILGFKLLGFQSTTQSVEVQGQSVSVRVTLKEMANMLSEVVTTVTGEQRKLEIGNSIATINVDSVIRIAPVSNLTDVLENRVPGLTVQRAGGRPGDPARIRLRGSSSINNSNDVIVVVDGVRVESELSKFGAESQAGAGTIMAASPLDQIDINSIEKIDVFKGPSAAAMYGSDAANGVIVITTKKGKAGPSKWTASMDHGVSYIPASFPEGVFRFGTIMGFLPGRCNITSNNTHTCEVDSIVKYQALNDPYFDILANGRSSQYTTSVSGGNNNARFSITASVGDNLGVVQMSPYLKNRFQSLYGTRIPSWMERPDRLNVLSISNVFSLDISSDLRIDLTTKLYRDVQKRTSLGSGGLRYFINLFHADTILNNDNFSESQKRTSDKFTSAASIRWSKFSWLPIHSTIGLDRIFENDQTYLPRGILFRGADSSGKYAMGRNMRSGVSYTVTSTVNTLSQRIITTIGINGLRNNTQSFGGRVTSLPHGISKPVSGFTEVTRNEHSRSTNGWFIEPRLNLRSNFFASPGIRLDQNGLQGGKAGLMQLPKLNISWLASESDALRVPEIVSLLRLRLAAGAAGVQPGIQDRLRLYSSDTSGLIAAPYRSNYMLKTLGNAKLKPERSTEYEWGADLDLLDGRVGLEFTKYKKIRRDAIVNVALAPSLSFGYGTIPNIKANIGEIRNSGTELMVRGSVIESSSLTLGGVLGYSQNSNMVTRLSANSDQYNLSSSSYMTESRVVTGYPLWGIWARPIVGYTDNDNNGTILSDEVRLADSSTYLGQPEPKGTLNLSSYMSILEGRLSVNVAGSFTYGGSQIATIMADGNSPFSTIANLEDATQFTRALAASSSITGYGLVQQVDTWRLNSMTIRYMVPQSIVTRLKSRTLSISVLGSNLFMRSRYMGADPNVNTSIYEDGRIADEGGIPPTRSWSLKFSIGN